MNRFNKFLATTFLLAAMFFTGAAQAMEIQQYDKMADRDQNEYVADLVIGTEKVLTDEGRPDQAEQVRKLFTEMNPGNKIPLGVAECEVNLALARVVDAKRVAQNPDARRLEVEDAIVVTLRKNNIELPPSFLTVNSNFKPKFPPREKEKKN